MNTFVINFCPKVERAGIRAKHCVPFLFKGFRWLKMHQWVLIVINKCWLSSMIVDCHQYVLIVINECWLSSMSVDRHQQLLINIDDSWQLLKTIENHWWPLSLIWGYISIMETDKQINEWTDKQTDNPNC